ncbi:MAG: hypothetical protein JWQ78_1302 [Sediminibacterium sp.]|nr:hypothetical protein [Sediminibacterium sp.]
MQTEKQSILIAILAGSIFIMLFGFITFLVFVQYVRKKRRLLSEKDIRETLFQQELLQAQLEMQDHTFRTVSQEIHDNVGQILGLAKVHLNILTLHGQGTEHLHNVKELVTQAIAELRNLGNGYFADSMVEEGLPGAIRHQLRQLDKTGLFKTSFHSTPGHLVIEKNRFIFLYRMIQEALSNVVKHSAGDKVDIRLMQKDTEVHIAIRDNGRGFDITAADFRPGIGLNSIHQRAQMIGARAEICSRAGAGTTITLIFKHDHHD